MKFSIIVPVYNVEKYIDKCLKSIENQSYFDFEVIIVNDGSLDNSQNIIDRYVKKDKRFKSFFKENGGLSDARNYGLNYINGDYLLFIDGDDYIDSDLLHKLNNVLSISSVDLVRFNCVTEDSDGKVLYNEVSKEFINSKMNDVICELITRTFVETACLYCYKIQFWNEHNFRFNIGRLHEDYGLIPLVLYYANTISNLNYIGYHYIQRTGSITKSNDYDKIVKKSFDTYYQYCDIVNILINKPKDIKKEAILTYLTECLIIKGSWLEKKDYKQYYMYLRKDKVYNNIATYNIKKNNKEDYFFY